MPADLSPERGMRRVLIICHGVSQKRVVLREKEEQVSVYSGGQCVDSVGASPPKTLFGGGEG